MEHSTEVGVTHDRAEFNANVSMQDLVSDYLVPFQSCIEKVRVQNATRASATALPFMICVCHDMAGSGERLNVLLQYVPRTTAYPTTHPPTHTHPAI